MDLPELVAPARDIEAAQAALEHGADAVYIGLESHNLRAHTPSFAVDDLDGILSLARRADARVYATLNAMPDDAGLQLVADLLRRVADAGAWPDAFVVSDPGVVALCRRICPAAPLHLSTQTGTFNQEAMRFWKAQGIARFIMPREITLAEMGAFSRAGIAPLEVFVHGAMCVAVSGRCLLGAYVDGRHANRGDCSQPCRLQYRITPCAPQGWALPREFDAEEDRQGVSLLNSKDLCCLPILNRIVATGVQALKIEGRNKSVHYVASVVKVYRQALDACGNGGEGYRVLAEWQAQLDALDHRPYTTGFYDGDMRLQAVRPSRWPAKLQVAGVVREVLADGAAVVDVKHPFTQGDDVDVLPVDRLALSYRGRVGSIADLSGTAIDRALTSRLVAVRLSHQLKPGDLLRLLPQGPVTSPSSA